MFRRSLVALRLMFLLIATAPMASLAGDERASPIIELSPELTTLLRAEMAELAGGIRSIALSLATADWKAIEETSEQLHGSYIMKRLLTQAQATELANKLPYEFKQLDAEFHSRAQKLGQAAGARDFELVAFRYSRLVESCAGCHSAFARNRFPGFALGPQVQHEH